jgi:sialate O-acetylesterase
MQEICNFAKTLIIRSMMQKIGSYFITAALLIVTVSSFHCNLWKNDEQPVEKGKGSNALLESGTVRYKIPLYGMWKFSIGDSMKWASPDYDDSGWESIKVPANWEDEGFHGYDGYAWYRNSFTIPEYNSDYMFLLELGRIDDVDEVYINGHSVGSTGDFPPDYETAYFKQRIYRVPSNYIRGEGNNIIAVRVYDDRLAGGMLDGSFSLIVYGSGLDLALDLSGDWKFRLGDENEYRQKGYGDADWETVPVPAYWNEFGYGNENGFAWYRKTFYAPQELDGKSLVLVLGKIDDIDEVYLNGNIIGYTGRMKDNESEIVPNNEYLEIRGYHIPEGELITGQENVIAVRVFDKFYQGGIYEGPIGIAEESEYLDFWRNLFITRHIE